MSTMTAAEKRQFTRLANLKVQAKEIEEKIKTLQDTLIDKYGAFSMPTNIDVGKKRKLCAGMRETWSKPSNDAVLEVLGKAAFLKYASITKAQVNKAGGEAAVNELMDRGEIVLTKSTPFYSVKAKC